MKDGKNYHDFIYISSSGGKIDVSKNAVGLAKACAPGMPSALSNPHCTQAGLKQECLNDLQDKCQQSGLASVVNSYISLDTGATAACDPSLLGANTNELLSSCVKFVTENMMNGFNFDPTAVINIETTVADTSATALRYLSSNDSYITTSDNSSNYTDFNDINISSDEVFVDNVTTAEATTTLKISGKYMKESAAIILMLAILI
jgi:hypothetical protein